MEKLFEEIDEQIFYTKGHKYSIHSDFRIKLLKTPEKTIKCRYGEFHSDGIMIIYADFPSDGSSGITWDTKSAMRNSFVHDFLYYLRRHGYLDESWDDYIDSLLEAIGIFDGMFEWRAGFWGWATNTFASFARNPKNKKKILSAP